jgi:endonuclease/exonuclease/phosphatase family metal-dependent hydrolase
MGKKILSLNVEGDKHLELVMALLKREDPDIVCLMEVGKDSIFELAKEQYPFMVFAPNDVLGNIDETSSLEPTGVAILSKEIAIDVEKEYFGEKPRNEIVARSSGSHAPILLEATIGEYRIGAIHFTWTKNGSVSQDQTKHLTKLIDKLSDEQVVLCGDFNIPRGNANYQLLAEKYIDNIPKEIETTLDPVLHYANKEEKGRLKLVVDYIWTTPKYRVSEVRVVENVSDHCALVFNVDLF